MGEHVKFDGEKLVLSCPSCAKSNAVPLEKLLEGPVCGACQAALPALAEVVEVTDSTFSQLIQRSPLPVLVDFWAPWCGPCRMMGPVLEAWSKKKQGQVLVAKLDTDQSPGTAGQFGIQAIPTFIAFRNGKEVHRQMGAMAEPALEKLLG